MNVALPILAQQPVGVSVVHDERGLQSFRDPDCAAAVWSREIPDGVSAWLAGLDADLLPTGRVVLPVAAVADTFRHLCDIAKTPGGRARDWLIADVAHLAEAFAGLMKVRYVRLRVQAVTTNACRKFHVDAITARLVCTYRGTGTQYGTSLESSDPEEVQTTPTGAPILLRGSLWPTKAETGLLHRSPPIEGTGETRLVLVLDPVSDLGEAA